MINSQKKPTQNGHLKYLISTGLFTKVGSGFRSNILKLNGTRYFIQIPPGQNIVLNQLIWHEIEEGSIDISENKINKNNRNPIKIWRLKDILTKVPKDISERLKTIFGIVDGS